MASGREIRAYDYVNQPYERVRDAFVGDALQVFQQATKVSSKRAQDVAAALRVNVGALEVASEIAITVKSTRHKASEAGAGPSSCLDLEWQAASAPRLFPLMSAELSLYPLTPSETQLDLFGRYEPPMGLVGGAIDTMVGHRVAEASVHRFLAEIADHLRKHLA